MARPSRGGLSMSGVGVPGARRRVARQAEASSSARRMCSRLSLILSGVDFRQKLTQFSEMSRPIICR
ncbi:hypothetical protein P775_26280 [Puniceibacterium antarcticum]|uniref:Uncharacterized protein n=2 Tax=Puniceibacterium antarcticum TaxID=1206336 RepID=A0A2G8QZT3_9RHOB|nr:hypothetical protein P775_26280 [Puniceibacterium antarcticum]